VKRSPPRAKPAPPPHAGARSRGVAPAALERAKRGSPAQLLFRCARRLNELALDRVAARTGLVLRASHTALFPHIDLAGTRQTELARRLGVSKQAVHQLVGELEAMDVLERVPDPVDRRATLVRFRGGRGRTLLDGLAVLGELEQELAATLGRARLRSLHRTLEALDAWLEAR
jgi:DNA-binding MarR family transcriptional regulator